MDMEELFEEIGRSITDAGKTAAAKARDLTEILQLKSQIGSEKSRLQETYRALGKLYYQEHQDEEEHPQAAVFEAVRESRKRIALMEEKLRDLENTAVCPACGARVSKDAVFCSRCGQKIVGNKEDEEI